MKQKMILSFILASLVSGSAFASATSYSDTVMQESMAAMQGMHDLRLTGNAEVDFLAGMVPHHEGAVVMSEMLQAKLVNAQLKQLAADIIKAQKEEILFMQTWLANNPTKPSDHTNLSASQKMLSASLNDMHAMHMAKMTGDADRDFVVGMVPHHQAAITMAEIILPQLKDKQVIAFAKEVIAVQKREIAQMKALYPNAFKPNTEQHHHH